MVGSAGIPFPDVCNALLSKLPVLNKLAGPVPATYETIIFQIRLPRILLGAMVGAGLAVAGTVLQALFKNPMAEPYIIGVSSGACLGATLAFLTPISSGWFGSSWVTLMSFLGATVTLYVVYNISKIGGKVPIETLLLAGIAVASFLSAITTFLMVQAGEDLHKIYFWLVGSLSAKGWAQVEVASVCVIVGIFVLYLFARDLNVMLTGEESASQLGVEVERSKKVVLAVSTLVTGAAVSVSGVIGFVGLVTPHMMRILVGPNHYTLIPASALAGGITLTLSDTAARMIFSPQEIPVGVVTALFGVPFFLYLLRKRRKAMF